MSGDDSDPFKKKPTYMGLLQLCTAASSSTSEDGHESESQNLNMPVSQRALAITAQESQDTSGQQPQNQGQRESVEEKRAWLENVLNTMFKSPVEAMAKHLDTLKETLNQAASSDPVPPELYERIELNLESLMQYTDLLDNAVDFHKLGGFEVLKPLLEMPHSGVRAKTLELIADLVQNNNYCQKEALEAGLLPILFELLDTDSDETVCVKALYAISCLCRHNASALSHLTEVDGFSKLLRAIQKPSEKLRTKTAFLLTHLSNQLPEVREIVFDMGIVQLLACLIQDDFRPSHEHVLSCLLSLVSHHEPSQKECLKPELGLKDSITSLMNYVQDYPECLEVRDYLKDLMVYCVPNGNENKTFEEMER